MATEEQERAVAAEAVKRWFMAAPVVRGTDVQNSVTAYEAEQEFPLDDRSDHDDMMPDAEGVTLNPTRQELDRFRHAELLEQLAKYVRRKGTHGTRPTDR